jgi:hypothetical protein
VGTAGRKWVRWSRVRREDFLDRLAATCNVKASAEHIGVDPASVYALHRKDADFAEAWQSALRAGYAALETELVGYVRAGGNAERTIDTAPGPIDIDTALRLLSAHRNSSLGKVRGGPPLRRATREETDAAILKKLNAMDQARKRDAEKS